MQGRLTAELAALFDRGLAVFPLPAGDKVAPAGWHQLVTTDPTTAAAWPAGNVGVGCRASAIVGLDLDIKANVDGIDTLRALCAAARRPLPATLTVGTAHGARHLYFRAPDDVVIASTIARWPGIDIRAPGRYRGGYLVAPGSVVDGRPYTLLEDRPPAPLPIWLTAHLAASAK